MSNVSSETGRLLEEGNISFFDHELRRATRAAVLKGGVSPQLADEITDIAIHAARQAVEALTRVAFTNPDVRVSIAVFGVAAGLALHRIRELHEIIHNAAREAGATTHTTVAQVRR